MTDKQYTERMRHLYAVMRDATNQRFGWRDPTSQELLTDIDGKVSRLLQLSRRRTDKER